MRPTNEFRWLIVFIGEDQGNHPSGIHIPDTNRMVVLQQWWFKPIYDGDEGEWRDVPMEYGK